MTNKKDVFDLAYERVIITAEIGINHNGDLKLAEEMIDAAAESGVDAVKFQGFKTEWMYSRLTPGFSHTESDVFAQMQTLEVRDDWWPRLKERTEKQGLLFSASVFDRPSLEILKAIEVDFIKIASAELNNHAFLEQQKVLGDVFVVSTGMALLEEVAAVVRFLESTGISKIILLECTSSYPAPPESTHLLNIDFLRDTFGKPAGFSDHTLGAHHAIAAVARGARFIEKHFTLDKNMAGPDQAISSDPMEMKTLVTAVREIEQSLKTNHKATFLPHEKDSREIGRKSVIALKKIKKGEAVTLENTVIKRPAKGIPPQEARFLYGRRAKQDIEPDQWITWEMV
ncbi:MAG: N-acetylneuraminate synthase [bacterium]|nr:N-acetylneuraminate synthase [bacterium]